MVDSTSDYSGYYKPQPKLAFFAGFGASSTSTILASWQRNLVGCTTRIFTCVSTLGSLMFTAVSTPEPLFVSVEDSVDFTDIYACLRAGVPIDWGIF